MVRVLGIGDNTVDIYVDQGVQFPGGNAVNVAVLARRLGAEASYLGCIGNDRFATLIRDALIAEGVDISHLRTLDAPNSWSRIRHEGGDRVFDGSRPNLRGAYDLSQDDFDFIAAHDLTHTSIYSKLEADLERVSAAAPILSFDYSSEYADAYLAITAPWVNIAFLSDSESSDEACRSLCAQVAALGPDTVVVLRGRKGAIGTTDGTFHEQPVLDGPVVDTLGAGDGFIAAFLMARLNGSDLPAALERGAANALHVCGYRGAFGYGVETTPDQPGLERPGINEPGYRHPADRPIGLSIAAGDAVNGGRA